MTRAQPWTTPNNYPLSGYSGATTPDNQNLIVRALSRRRFAISWVATTGGIDSSDIRDLMIESVERRFGLVDKLPNSIEWLSDNGSPYTAGDTRTLARYIGLVP